MWLGFVRVCDVRCVRARARARVCACVSACVCGHVMPGVVLHLTLPYLTLPYCTLCVWSREARRGTASCPRPHPHLRRPAASSSSRVLGSPFFLVRRHDLGIGFPVCGDTLFRRFALYTSGTRHPTQSSSAPRDRVARAVCGAGWGCTAASALAECDSLQQAP